MGMLAVFPHDDGSHGLRHLDARGTATRMRLGEMGHPLNNVTALTKSHDYESGWPDSNFPFLNSQGKSQGQPPIAFPEPGNWPGTTHLANLDRGGFRSGAGAAKGLRQTIEQVGSNQGVLTLVFAGNISRQPVKINRRHHRLWGLLWMLG